MISPIIYTISKRLGIEPKNNTAKTISCVPQAALVLAHETPPMHGNDLGGCRLVRPRQPYPQKTLHCLGHGLVF